MSFTSNVLSLNSQGFGTMNKDPKLSDTSFNAWRQFIYDKCGIYFLDNKKYLLESRLLRRMKFLGLDSYEKYFDYVRYNSHGSSEIKYLYEAITINETYFFRNQPQLNALASSILPELMEQKRKTGQKKIRIWSAASSSGEEAYSIAMMADDLVKPKYPEMELEVVGTDINFAVIDIAKKGLFKEYSVRNTPPYYLKKYFTTTAEGFQINNKIKSAATFRELNLFDDFSMRSMINYDIIFCSNVLIYFDTASKIKVVSHLYNSLNRNGYLFIGYSETLHGISKAFKVISFPKTIAYKKEQFSR